MQRNKPLLIFFAVYSAALALSLYGMSFFQFRVSSEIYSVLEATSSVIGIIAAISCILLSRGLGRGDFLIVGIGILILSSVDLPKALLASETITTLFGIKLINVGYLIGIHIIGRIMLIAILVYGIMLYYRVPLQMSNQKIVIIGFTAFFISLLLFFVPDNKLLPLFGFNFYNVLFALFFIIMAIIAVVISRNSTFRFRNFVIKCILILASSEVSMFFSNNIFDHYYIFGVLLKSLALLLTVLFGAFQLVDEIRNALYEGLKRKNAENELKSNYKIIDNKNKEFEKLNKRYSDQNRKLRMANIKLKTSKQMSDKRNTLKQAFFHRISKEIRTSMHSILGFTNLLDSGKISDDIKEQYTGIIKSSGNNLLSLVEDIEVISHIESGRLWKSESRINLNNMLKEIVKEYSQENSNFYHIPIELHTGLADDKSNIIVDNVKLKQVLKNLLSNACKYTRKGSITIKYKAKDNSNLVFSIEDTGEGISREKQLSLFNYYKKTDVLIIDDYFESGLGLPICKALIDNMKGNIWVESELGKGSNFCFSIKYKSSVSDFSPDYDFSIVTDKLRNKKVLIVDDDYFNTLFLEKYLINNGITVIKVINGFESIKAVEEDSSIALVFMDIHLPGMNGFEAAKQIKTFNNNIVIIAQTANVYDLTSSSLDMSGCDDIISKPIQMNILYDKILNYLN